MNHAATITTVPASGPGAVSGYEVRCECGATWRTSVCPEASAAEHVAYWEGKR